MPYITPQDRHDIARNGRLWGIIKTLFDMTDGGQRDTGKVVYVVYKLLKEVYGHGNFEVKSNALKVLESAKLEYYRRIMTPYEDKKIKENGDV